MSNQRVIVGHALAELRKMPDESVDCCVCSPPYYSLRSYGTEPQVWGGDPDCRHRWAKQVKPAANGIRHEGGIGGGQVATLGHPRKPSGSCFCTKCGAWLGELGQEPSLQLFIHHMVEIFREVRRVLKRHGTLWVNMGDTYAGSNNGQSNGASGQTNLQVPPQENRVARNFKASGLKEKDRCMVPARLAIALCDDGWWLRDEIIWHKPAPMPSSVTDRTTPAHEMLYTLSKGKRYFYNQDAIAEPLASASLVRLSQPIEGQQGSARANGGNGTMKAVGQVIERPRDVELDLGMDPAPVADLPDSYKGSMPGRKDGPGQDRRSRLPRGRDMARGSGNIERKHKNASSPDLGSSIPWNPGPDSTRNKRSVWTINTQSYGEDHYAAYPEELPRTCILAGCKPGGVVLDIFGGRGTTMVVCKQMGFDGVAIELNPEYAAMMVKNLADTQAPLL